MPFGGKAWNLGKWAKRNFERVLLPNAFWEEMGFIYLGPLDGHNIKELEAAFTRARDSEQKPVILHVLTIKGRGHEPAENNATRFHGLSPTVADRQNDASSYSQVFGSAMVKLMRQNEKVIAISAAMIDGTGLSEASRLFPDRVIDVGIGEQHAVTMAAGLASQGFIPVVAIYSTFLQRAYDQIVHDVCIPNLPVVFAIDRAGIVGEDGVTHQGAFDISYLNAIPNIIISAPRDENELQHLLYTATKAGRPMAIRYPKGYGAGTKLEPEFRLIEIGKAQVLRDGSDLTLLALGRTVRPAFEAAGILARDGLSCAVIDSRFAKPLDSELILKYGRLARRIITLEENVLIGGFGSSVRTLFAREKVCEVTIDSLGLPDHFIEHGNADLFRTKFNLDAEGIADHIRYLFPELPVESQSAQS
jgi:1-deoxy-D-xylulose-5-phosphate synthase